MAITNREIINRRAKFEYHFVQEFEAGIVLTGTEVKAIRAGNANLTDAYCVFWATIFGLKYVHCRIRSRHHLQPRNQAWSNPLLKRQN